MQPKTIEAANKFLATLDGANVSFNDFVCSHQRFVLAIAPIPTGEAFGLSFPSCLFLAGPTAWGNAKLRCKEVFVDGFSCYETEDQVAGFVVRSASIVKNGEEGLVFGSE